MDPRLKSICSTGGGVYVYLGPPMRQDESASGRVPGGAFLCRGVRFGGRRRMKDLQGLVSN